MKRFIILYAFFSLLFSTFALQQFKPVQDGYIYQYGDAGNFSSAGMELKKSSSFSREIYLSFDISNLVTGGNSAFLRLYCSSYDKNSDPFIAVDGFEGEVPAALVWTNKAALPAMTEAASAKGFTEEQVNQYYEWNVSSFVKDMLAKKTPVFSFRVYVSGGNDVLMKFNSSENPENKPVLEISEEESPYETVHTIVMPEVFNDYAVLQRNKPVPVWGAANPEKELTVLFNGQEKSVMTDAAGNWHIQLDAMPAGGPFEMEIRCDSDTIRFADILVGDVYLAGGQSNMAFRVASLTPEARGELAQDIDYPDIRYYRVAQIVSGGVLLNEADRPWTKCSNARIDDWSAVATYFARNIHKEEGVPVGIIGCNHGGSMADAWISPEAYAADPALDAAKVIPFTSILQYYCNPSSLYEAMLKKVAGYQLRGFIWYQGEANAKVAARYETIFSGLIKDWRRIWNDEKLPFIFAQLAAYKPTDDPEGTSWALLREQQLKTSQHVDQAAMVVTIDVGELDDIHPKDKKTVGNRFTLAAKKLIYGEDVEASGPVFDHLTITGSAAYVAFKHAANGLQSVEDDLSEFEICGDDFMYKPAHAVIEGNQVKVWSDEVARPVAVRYAWKNGPQPTLYNAEGLPASPFRSMADPEVETTHIPFDEFSVYSSGSYASREAVYAFNGAGMNSDEQTHVTTVNSVAWHSGVGKAYPYYLKVNFNNPESIDKIRIWNLNWSSYLARGIKDMDVYYAVSEDDLSSVPYSDQRWQQYDSFSLPAADGTPAYSGEILDFGIMGKVSWIGFNIRSNQGDANGYVGVSEIRFFREAITANLSVQEQPMLKVKNERVFVANIKSTPLDLTLTDLMGRTLKRRQIAAGEIADIALNDLPGNLYVIGLCGAEYAEYQKILIPARTSF